MEVIIINARDFTMFPHNKNSTEKMWYNTCMFVDSIWKNEKERERERIGFYVS